MEKIFLKNSAVTFKKNSYFTFWFHLICKRFFEFWGIPCHIAKSIIISSYWLIWEVFHAVQFGDLAYPAHDQSRLFLVSREQNSIRAIYYFAKCSDVRDARFGHVMSLIWKYEPAELLNTVPRPIYLWPFTESSYKICILVRLFVTIPQFTSNLITLKLNSDN